MARNLRPIIKGYIGGVLVTPLATSIYMLGVHLTSPTSKASDFWTAIHAGFLVGLVGMLLVAPFLAVSGVALFMWLHSIGRANFYACLLSALLPCLAFWAYSPMLGVWMSWQALASAVTFWCFVRHTVETRRTPAA